MDSNIVFSVYELTRMVLLFFIYATVFYFAFIALYQAINGY